VKSELDSDEKRKVTASLNLASTLRAEKLGPKPPVNRLVRHDIFHTANDPNQMNYHSAGGSRTYTDVLVKQEAGKPAKRKADTDTSSSLSKKNKKNK
jgi:hypothetical protein